MSVLAFDQNIRRQIKRIIEYANNNVYQIDNILDMKNNQMTVPGERPEHLILVPIGRWICYYIVDHPEHGYCHYFQIKPDSSGKLPDKPTIEYIAKEFGIKGPLHDKNIAIDKMNVETKVIIPFAL